jgi:hypothetical protein
MTFWFKSLRGSFSGPKQSLEGIKILFQFNPCAVSSSMSRNVRQLFEACHCEGVFQDRSNLFEGIKILFQFNPCAVSSSGVENVGRFLPQSTQSITQWNAKNPCAVISSLPSRQAGMSRNVRQLFEACHCEGVFYDRSNLLRESVR